MLNHVVQRGVQEHRATALGVLLVGPAGSTPENLLAAAGGDAASSCHLDMD
nr:hypothetical protein GCM10020241_65790 [Streptoalloteichus tenebrarius]